MKLQRRSLLRLGLAGGAVLAIPGIAAAQVSRRAFGVVPISIKKVNLANGQLVASGLVGNQPFTAPLDLGLAADQSQATDCPILNLQLAPIHLNLLGLAVDTSAICLSITALPGRGLLGDLLCGIAHLLDGGLSLTDILNQLTRLQLLHLLNGLRNLLNEALFNQLGSNLAVTSVTGTQAGACDILNLQLGPLDLTLLGLNVHLDDCAGGPVTLAITAIPGAGNLLGNLLCSLAGLLDGGAATNLIDGLLRQIAGVIGQLLG